VLFGYNLFDYMELNPKSEARNSKQIQITKIQMFQTRLSFAGVIVLVIVILNF